MSKPKLKSQTNVNTSALEKQQNGQLNSLAKLDVNDAGQLVIGDLNLVELDKKMESRGVKLRTQLKQAIKNHIIAHGSAFTINAIQSAFNEGMNEGMAEVKLIEAAAMASVQENLSNLSNTLVSSQVQVEAVDNAWLDSDVDVFALMGGEAPSYGLGGDDNAYEATTSEVVDEEDQEEDCDI